MDHMSIYSRVRSVPASAQKTIKGGRLNNMTDINPMWRIQTLTELFGPCGTGWTYKVVKREFTEGANGAVAVWVDIELIYKDPDTGEMSMPIPGTGGSMFVAKETNGLYTDDEAPKKALTDAISVACKALGIGADIYWAKGSESKYSGSDAPEPKAKSEPQPTSKPAAQSTPVVSEEHIKTLLMVANQKGYDAATLAKQCKKKYDCELKDMNGQQFAELMMGYKGMPDKVA